MSRKTKRNLKENDTTELLEEPPKYSKTMLLLYRITVAVLGIVAITIICAILLNKMFPNNQSVWPSLFTMGLWGAWIVYVFKFMKIK